MERLSKKSDRPTTKKVTLALVMLACMLALAFVPVFVTDGSDADTDKSSTWTYETVSGNNVKITGYSADSISVDLVIPSKINSATDVELTVVEIGAITATGSANLATVKSISFGEGSEVATIGIDAFKAFTEVVAVDIPSSVETIDKTAFKGLASLERVTGGSSVETINDEAFSGCEKLETFGPMYVETVATKAFYNCASLAGFSKEAEPNIAGDAFEGCNSLWFYVINDDGTIKLTECYDKGINYKVRIPNGFNGHNVVVLECFDNMVSGSIMSVDFQLPSKVTTIKAGVFDVFEDAVTINIPDSVTTIEFNEGKAAIASEWLEEITVHTDNRNYVAYDGVLYGVEYDAKGNVSYTLLACPMAKQTIAFKPGVTTIADNAFRGSMITEVTLPASITSIGDNAFLNCEGLTAVKGGSGLKTIGDYTFAGCEAMTVFEPANLIEIGDNAFAACKTLGNIGTTKVTTIGDAAFESCESITKFSINALTSLGEGVFAGCKSLQAFEGTSSKYTTSGGILYLINSSTDKELVMCPVNVSGNIEIPANVTKIQSSAFFGCDKVVSLTLPDSLSVIGDKAFYGCNSLELVVSWVNPLTVIEQNDETFKKTNEGTKIVTDLRCPGLNVTDNDGGAKTLDSGARHMIVKQIGANVYCFLKDVSPYYYLYIIVHGSGTDKSIKFGDGTEGTYVKPWADGEDWGTSDREHNKIDIKLNTICVVETGGVTNIPEDMFKGFGMLQSIEGFNGGIGFGSATTVGANAFKDCVSLEQLNLPKVTTIADNAFDGCFCLESISIPAAQTIGAQAFINCGNLASISLPSAVKTINSETFKACASLKTATMPGVKEIAENAFCECSSLEEVSAAALTTIGSEAFLKCSNLKTITLSAVTSVGDNAFDRCKSLEEVNLPSVTTIGVEAFKDCTSIKNVTIKSAATSVDTDAFDGCTSIEKFAVSGTAGKYSAIDGVLIQSVTENKVTTKTIVCFPKAVGGTYTVPSGINAIGTHAFKDSSKITEITLGTGVTVIGDEAFMNCTAVEKFLVWGTIGEVGDDIFSIKTKSDKYGVLDAKVFASKSVTANNLAESKTENTADYSTVPLYTIVYQMDQCGPSIYAYVEGTTLHLIGSGDMYPYIKKDDWSGVTHIDFDDRITSIGAYAFMHLELAELTLPKSLKTIGESAFSGSHLPSIVNIPSGVTSIGAMAFSGSFTTKEIKFADDAVIDEFGDSAFFNSGLKSFDIPKTVTKLGNNPFHDIYGLSLTSSSPNFVIVDGILYDKEMTRVIYCSVDYKGDYDMPDTIEQVDSGAFSKRVNLKSVSFPESLKVIMDEAFSSCDSLEAVMIPFGSLEIVGGGAFGYCEGIKTIVLPESVSYIGAGAFEGCTNAELTILKCLIDEEKGKDVEIAISALGHDRYRVGYNVDGKVYATDALKDKIKNPTFDPELSSEVVAYLSAYIFDGEISPLIPCGGSVYAYVSEIAGTNPTQYKLNIIGEGSMFDKYNWGWENADKITEVGIASKVTKLGAHVFDGLTALQTIVIPENITTVPDYAFNGCTSLVNVILGSKITSIGVEAFHGCTALTGTVTYGGETSTLTIPKAVKSIGVMAFFGCGNLERIILDCNATIAKNAFPGDYSAMLDDKGISLDSLYTYDFANKVWNYMDHTVTWKVEGVEVQKVRVHDGAPVPAYTGETPVKKADKQYYYTFENWTPRLDLDPTASGKIYKDTVFTAVFISTVQKYSIEYKDPLSANKYVDNAEYGAYYLKDCMLTAPEGKIFAGWKVDGAEKSARSMITLEKNTVAEAVWIDNYTITYAAGDHGTGTVASVKTTGSLTLPGQFAFTAEVGWQFKGWNVDGTVCAAGATVTVTKSQTVTAVWEGKHVITYSAGLYGVGDDFTDRFPLTITFADSKFQPKTEQYYFIGWSFNGMFFEPGDTFQYGQDATAVAQWGIKKVITYDGNGGTGSMPIDYVVEGKTYQLKANAFTAPHTYAFKAWDVNGVTVNPGQLITVGDDTVIKAIWELGIPVSFYANGGDGHMDDVYVLANTWYMPGECEFYPPENKIFRIWTVNTIGVFADVVNSVYISSPLTFVADWKDLIPVTVDPNGGTGYAFTEYVVDSYELPDIEYAEFEAPEGQAFYAWDVNGIEYQPGDFITVDKAVTVKAVWKNYYTVTYDANGGTGTMSAGYAFEYTPYTIKANAFTAPEGDPTVFSKWTFDDGTEAYPGDIIVMTEDVVLKAQWIPAYTVSFNANGGTGEMASVPASGSYVVPECAFVAPRENMYFDKWLLPDGTTAVAPGETIEVAGDMTLTATWLEAFEVKVAANSYGTASADAKFALPGTVVKLTKTPYAGCEFVSWEVTPGTVKIVNDSFTMPDQAVTVKAIFQIHVDTEISDSCDFGSVSIPIDSEITSEWSVKLSMYKITSPKQSNIPKDATVYEIHIDLYKGTEKKTVEGKTATVFIKYQLALGEITDDLKVYYVSEDGKTVENMNAVYDSAKGGLVFKTTHFSDFVITHENMSSAGNDYIPIIGAVIIMVVLILVALLFAWKHKLNNSI